MGGLNVLFVRAWQPGQGELNEDLECLSISRFVHIWSVISPTLSSLHRQIFAPLQIILQGQNRSENLFLSLSQPPSGESSLIFRKLNFNKVFRQKVSCGHIVITIHHLITSSYHHIFISGAAWRFLIIIISNMIRLSSSRYFIKHNTKIILCCYD